MMKSDPCMIRSQSTPTIWDFLVGFALAGIVESELYPSLFFTAPCSILKFPCT